MSDKVYDFNAEFIYNSCVDWIKNWFSSNAGSGAMAVIGISGGKDSALTAKLLTDALGKERVFGVMLPNGIQSDIEDSRKVCDFLGIKHATIKDLLTECRKSSAKKTLTIQIIKQTHRRVFA